MSKSRSVTIRLSADDMLRLEELRRTELYSSPIGSWPSLSAVLIAALRYFHEEIVPLQPGMRVLVPGVVEHDEEGYSYQRNTEAVVVEVHGSHLVLRSKALGFDPETGEAYDDTTFNQFDIDRSAVRRLMPGEVQHA